MRITLCGSAKFEEIFHNLEGQLTLAGHVVYGLAVYPSTMGGNKDWYTPEQKSMLDAVHLCKIDNSDAIVVINLNTYIGESTRREIDHAISQGKKVFYLEGEPNYEILIKDEIVRKELNLLDKFNLAKRTLQFYANEQNYISTGGTDRVLSDAGTRAREILTIIAES